LANLVAHRQNGCFPMIGKKFSNGWKISAYFSNDWKNFSRVFQRLEKSFERLVWQRDGNGGHVKGMGLSIHFMNWTGNKMLTLLG
jgi:hypothetical protein